MLLYLLLTADTFSTLFFSHYLHSPEDLLDLEHIFTFRIEVILIPALLYLKLDFALSLLVPSPRE